MLLQLAHNLVRPMRVAFYDSLTGEDADSLSPNPERNVSSTLRDFPLTGCRVTPAEGSVKPPRVVTHK